MPMSAALAASRNCATAYIMKQLGNGSEGPKKFVDFLRNCNVQTKIDVVPAIALGSCEISLYEMIQAYTVFPGRGFIVKPQYLLRIEDNNGNVLQNFMPERKEVMSDLTAYSVIDMMQGVVKFGTGKRLWSYGVKGAVAGKTGTTNDNSDAWFMGYSPELLTGVWAGCDDRFIRFTSTGIGQGAAAALPVWAYYYKKVTDDKKLGYSDTASFIKPEITSNEVNYDWVNNIHIDLGAEGEDIGSGDASDYMDGSMFYEDGELSEDSSGVEQDKQNSPPSNANDSAQKPKAVMPKRDSDPGLKKK
jgi:penicillin-binding protein 1A